MNAFLNSLGALVLVTALVAVGQIPRAEPLPPTPPPSAPAPTTGRPAGHLDPGPWLGPWVVPVRRTEPAPPPSPKPAGPAPGPAVEVPVDRTSVRYVGSMEDADGRRRYFFKVAATGQVLTLVEGQPSGPWTLTRETPKLFSLVGPGGAYEVAR